MEGGDNSLMGKKERIRKKETICSNATTALYLFPAAQVDAAGSIKKSKQAGCINTSVCLQGFCSGCHECRCGGRCLPCQCDNSYETDILVLFPLFPVLCIPLPLCMKVPSKDWQSTLKIDLGSPIA